MEQTDRQTDTPTDAHINRLGVGGGGGGGGGEGEEWAVSKVG